MLSVTQFSGFGANDIAADPAAAVYWQIVVDTVNTSTNVSIAEMQMMESVGGSDSCSGGTASANGQLSAAYSPDKAFDDNAATMWNKGFVSGDWLRYQHSLARNIVQYSIAARNDNVTYLKDTPKDWRIQKSTDGVSWTTVHTVTGQTSWTLGEVRTFTI